MSKRFFWLLTSLVVLAMFAVACGGGGAAPEPAAEEPQEEAMEEEAMEEEAMEEEAMEEEAMEEEAMAVECTDPLGCVTVGSGDALKIASALVIAGPNETLGIDSQTGVEVAIKQRSEVAGHSAAERRHDRSPARRGVD